MADVAANFTKWQLVYYYYKKWSGLECFDLLLSKLREKVRLKMGQNRPKFKDEESRYVQGQHEPLISETLFYHVQDVLNGRKNAQLEEANKRLSKARDLLLAGDIGADDYRTIKSESEEKIHRLEAKLTASVTTDIGPLLNKAISNISQLDVLYANGSITQKRKIISSMFPEKLTFDGFQYRTNRVNGAINLVCLIDKKLGGKKMGQVLVF